MTPEKSLTDADIAAILSSTKTKNSKQSYTNCVAGFVALDNEDPWITHIETRFNVEANSAKMALAGAIKNFETEDADVAARLADIRVIAHEQLGCVLFRVSAVGDILAG